MSADGDCFGLQSHKLLQFAAFASLAVNRSITDVRENASNIGCPGPERDSPRTLSGLSPLRFFQPSCLGWNVPRVANLKNLKCVSLVAVAKAGCTSLAFH
jgi:hypothetical protein